jgi:hypothetical protein
MNIDGLTIHRARRCKCCGQILPLDQSDDPILDDIKLILQHVGGHVPMRVILDVLPYDITRWPVYERLKKLEANGIVRRDPEHPRSGWHYIPEGVREQELALAA